MVSLILQDPGIIKIDHYVCFCIYFGLMKSQTFDFAGNQKFALGLIPISVLQYVDIDLHTIVFFLALHAEFLLLINRDNSSTCSLCTLHFNFLKKSFSFYNLVRY